jgi:catechol 2,3-dioxygenase-like lactoylglutathione lyase family enzyme
MTVADSTRTQFDVGGVLLDQPFKIRRLGHMGLNLENMEQALPFYTDLLGFRVSDTIDFSTRASDPSEIEGLGDPKGYFMRYGSDHHSFVLFNKRVREALDKKRTFRPGITLNQVTWQVGSMNEVQDAIRWFNETNVTVQRVGRDMPGSNWHAYLYDPDGHTNELYYGIEQIGWSGHSKPPALYERGFHEAPSLPQISEYQEIQDAMERGVDMLSGNRYVPSVPATYDVDGILLARPFKIVRLGPIGLFVDDVATAEDFYTRTLGFIRTREVTWNGHRVSFLRANTEHHSLTLYPTALREALGFSQHTTLASIGFQLANYRQLRDAVRFLKKAGISTVELPADLRPGIDYAIHFLDPDGHVIQLYYYMEQVGWDGRPRPSSVARNEPADEWPATLPAQSDTYMGEPYLGPWE